ncbi:hypothetical protein Sjap_009612 [Stephania japonica]|uniref:NAD-dependent epimerase/dehydratase domain-containing protein n=1 Tax=Stephania japonica TaxID=461633 RepID=A0AAP0J8U6_9MAGN
MDKKASFKSTVCVTGASGYLASWLVKRLLLSGYQVIGTVRDPGSLSFLELIIFTCQLNYTKSLLIDLFFLSYVLWPIFRSMTDETDNHEKLKHLWQLQGAKEALQLVKADLMVDGSFDDAIMGCDGVFHVASPVLGPKSNPKAEILDPAIKGTLNVLKSCKRSSSVKRVILTSSSAAVRVREDFETNVPLNESSWSSVELCQRLQIWYALSKVEAEKAAWEFAKENAMDLVTVLPSFVIGPSLPQDLCSTASDVLGLLKGESEKFSWHGRMGYVHIDDVALCHILVYEEPSAQGRYLCSSVVLDNNELASLLGERYPSLPIPKRFMHLDRPYYKLDTSKLESLGFKFRGVEEMFDDCIESLKEQGRVF